jgi:hypothetical protein
MISAITSEQRVRTGSRTIVARLAGSALLSLALSSTAHADAAADTEGDFAVVADSGPVGRVVAVRGEAYATAPGGEPRALSCDSPIYVGDEITTADAAGLGVLSGAFYARLGEGSELRFARTSSGTPDLDLAVGHLRLLDAGEAGTPVGRIVTPGLVAAKASRDSEALVLREKISLVSMICGWDGGLDVSRVGRPGQVAHPASGQCAIGKPREALYTAKASHNKLPIMDEAACPTPDELRLGLITDRFTPYDVASMLPPVDAAGPILMPNVLPPTVALREPCTAGSTCAITSDFTFTTPVIPPPGPPAPPGGSFLGLP